MAQYTEIFPDGTRRTVKYNFQGWKKKEAHIQNQQKHRKKFRADYYDALYRPGFRGLKGVLK